MVVLLYPGTVALLVLRAPWYCIGAVDFLSSFPSSRRLAPINMALFHILAKFDALDEKIGRDKIPRARLPAAAGPRSAAAARTAAPQAKTKTFGSFGRTEKHRQTRHRQTRQRPASAFAGSRPGGYLCDTRFAQPPHLWSWNRASLAANSSNSDGDHGGDGGNGGSTASHFERQFYFLRIAVEAGDVYLDVHITDLTSPDRPSFVYRGVRVNAANQIVFRDTPIQGCGAETLNVISPVDDFPFVSKPAQMLGHTLRVRVMSRTDCIVDTCCHFKGRNKGPRALEAEELLRRKGNLQRSISSRAHRRHHHQKNQKSCAGESQRQRPASAMATLSSSLSRHAAEKTNDGGAGEKKERSLQLDCRPAIRPSSPIVETRRVRLSNKNNKNSKRRRQPSQLTEDVGVVPLLESPGTELRNMRENLRLNISKFRHDISQHKSKRSHRPLSLSPKRRTSGSQNYGRPPRRSDYDATDRLYVDPDQLLKELNGQAASVRLKAWSPKASQTGGHF